MSGILNYRKEIRFCKRNMLRIQGFPDTYKIVLPYGKIKHQCGNSVAVPVIKAIAKEMIDALKAFERSKI